MESCPPPDEPEERCRSILGAAVDARDTECVLAVLRHKGYERPSGKNNDLCMPLAIESNELGFVQALVAAKVKLYRDERNTLKPFWSPKHNALVLTCSLTDRFGSHLGRCGLLRLILSNLTEDDKRRISFATALGYIFDVFCKSDCEDHARYLLSEFAHILLDSQRLVVASANGQALAVRMLLEHGAVVRVRDEHVADDCYNALQAACLNDHLDVVRLLIQHGLKVNYVHSLHGTPLTSAWQSGHMRIG